VVDVTGIEEEEDEHIAQAACNGLPAMSDATGV
jgi:hypothetical protein